MLLLPLLPPLPPLLPPPPPSPPLPLGPPMCRLSAKTACERELRAFILICATVRLLLPRESTSMAESRLSTFSKGRCSPHLRSEREGRGEARHRGEGSGGGDGEGVG